MNPGLVSLVLLFSTIAVFGAEPFGELTLPVYSPSLDLMSGTEKLPATWRVALSRINEYRRAAALPDWRYDPELDRMAMAHVHYVLLNGAAGRPTRGHFERAEFPGYSREGHEAAGTSGLAGGSNPLVGLESLVAGVYHRLQFVDPRPMRVGMGFGCTADGEVSSCLFVSRPVTDGGGAATPRFNCFPPSGSTGIPLTFVSEWPDPRPAPQFSGQPDLPTGYIISVQLGADDEKKFRGCTATLSDAAGSLIPCWLTDPANPTWKVPPPGIEKVFAGYQSGSGNNPFSGNLGMIFLMPRQPLEPGTTYSVRMQLTIGAEVSPLEWSFTTVRHQAFVVQAGGDPAGVTALPFALGQAIAGDGIILEAGEHQVGETWLMRSLQFKGRGAGTILTGSGLAPEENMFNCLSGTFTVRDLTVRLDRGNFLYAQPRCAVLLERVRLERPPGRAAHVAGGGRLELRQCTVENVGVTGKCNPFFIGAAAAGKPDGILLADAETRFRQINESITWGGVGLTPQPGRTWQVTADGPSLLDALRLTAAGDTIQLPAGEVTLAQPWWVARALTITGAGRERTILSSTVGRNDSLFCLWKEGDLTVRDLTLSGSGTFFYARNAARVTADNLRIVQPAGWLAVLTDQATFRGERLDLLSYMPGWLLSLENAASYSLGKSTFPENRPQVWAKKQSVPVREDPD